MANSPARDDDDSVHVQVLSNGQPIDGRTALISVHVRRAVGTIPTARLVIADGDLAASTFPVADSGTFTPGAAIAIRAGYGLSDDILFEGVVVKLGLSVIAERGVQVEVECLDNTARLAGARRTATFVDQTDAEIIKALASRAALTAAVDATDTRHEQLVQYQCTDWDFLLARAEANGRVVIAEIDGLSVRAPRVDANASLKVTLGVDLIEFEAEVRSEHPRSETTTSLHPAALATPPAARQVDTNLSRIRGRMTFQGSATPRVGGSIEVNGVGAHYSGNIFVGAIEHRIAEGHWTTTIEMGLSPSSAPVREPAAAAEAPGGSPDAAGLQTGIVTAIAGDPTGGQRIRLMLPSVGAGGTGLWARLAQCHASNGFGAHFLPEIGDEVVVAFFNHDPASPVVLGSLYSKHRPPPYAPSDENDTKAFVSRCRSRIEFDETDKAISIVTPAHNTIIVSDQSASIRLQDQHGNRIEMHAGGIAISTPKDLALTAKGTITFDALGPINVASKADVVILGSNVSCEAQGRFGANGAASAELSSGGQTIVRGGLVLIN